MTQIKTNEKKEKQNAFFTFLRHPFLFRLYLFKKLPAALFCGVKVETADTSQCTTSVSYQWSTRNPFRSTYFASLCMAAELSTGVLVMAEVKRAGTKVSVIISGMKASFVKKATGRTFFSCIDGDAIKNALAQAIQTGEAQTVKVLSTGINANGERVAECWFTWSFKVKQFNDPRA